MSIYTINDELTPQPVTTVADNTSATPDLQQQLGALEAQRQADLDHINRNYQDLNQEYDDQLDIIDNLHKTVSRRKVVDPRAVQARQALGSLYDTIQLIGSAASMAGKTTPPAPQLTSAQAQQNTIADRLYAAQQQADQDYATQLRLITQRQQQARADIAKQRRQSKTEADRMRLNTNKHYDTQATRILEGERDRQEREENTKEDVFKKSYGDFFTVGDSAYFIPKKYESSFQIEMADLIDDNNIDFSEFSSNSRTPLATQYRRALRYILSNRYPNLSYEAITRARRILNKYATPYIDFDNNDLDFQLASREKSANYNRDLLFELYKQAHLSGYDYAPNFVDFVSEFADENFGKRFATDYIYNFGAFGDLTDPLSLYKAIYNKFVD